MPLVNATPDEDAAYRWIVLMNTSIREQTYQGRFVHQQGKILQTMALRHVVSDGKEIEQLKSLNGPIVEVVRNHDQVVLIHQGHTGLTKAKKFRSDRKFSSLLPLKPEKLRKYYHLRLGGEERVAGRIGQVINIIPQDDLRYGYRLVLDKEFALPLDTRMVSRKDDVLSRMMFTELTVGDVPGADILASVPKTIEENNPHEDNRHLSRTRWHFLEKPEGFVLNIRRLHFPAGKNKAIEHFIFTDGIASISVYVEKTKNVDGLLDGIGQVGAVNAVGKQLSNHQVIVVGEVPVETLKRLLDGMTWK